MPPSKQILLCLGAGTHQTALIQKGRQLGYQVVAVDRNAKAIGLEFADYQVRTSITEPAEILNHLTRMKLEKHIVGVVTRSFGKVIECAAELSAHLGTPGPGLHMPHQFQDKRKFKTWLKNSGIAVPEIYSWQDKVTSQRILNSSHPLLARPATGHGKRGLERLDTKSSKSSFLNRFPVDDGTWLIEKIIPGLEVTVMGLVRQGQCEIISVTDKITSKSPPLYIELEHRYPASVSQKQLLKIKSLMQQISSLTKLENTPVVAEFIIPPEPKIDQNIYLVECAPETGGEYLAEKMLPAVYPGVDYFTEIIQLATNQVNLPSKYKLFNENKITDGVTKAMGIFFVSQKEGILKSIQIAESITKDPDVSFIKQLKHAADHTSLQGGNQDRLAVFGLSAINSDELTKKSRQIISSINISYE